MARLTDKWTPTLEEAFGESGKKGKLGEDYMMEVFKSWGWECELHESDKKLQMDGIDITFIHMRCEEQHGQVWYFLC